MLNLTRTPRFSPRVPEQHQAKKSQILLTDLIDQSQIAIELRHILYKQSNGYAIAHSAVWRTYNGINEPFDTTVKKGESFTVWASEEPVSMIVQSIDTLERVDISIHAPNWIAIERMDMEKEV
tara:strand:- start:77949 stop:78317 length:369 start_codon:yes stop_codon:yes gene_type:complete